MPAYNKSFWVSVVKRSSGRLDMVERINEVIFGLIMVLTFTCTINAATEGREEVGTVLWAALGCNVAWGIIDAFFYLFSALIYRGESLDTLKEVRNSKDDEAANEAIRDALPPLMTNLMTEEQLNYYRTEIRKLPEPPSRSMITWNDLFGAV